MKELLHQDDHCVLSAAQLSRWGRREGGEEDEEESL
jgi:hypothetical protein